MPLPFGKELDLKLLRLIKDNPTLYNPKHTRYLDYDAREVVWHKIGDALNRPPTACKSRWVNIRDMMRRKIRDRLRNPGQHSYNYKYEGELAFMMPYFKQNFNTSNEYEEFTEELEEPSAIFVTDPDDFVDERETKIDLRQMKRTEDFDGIQDLNPTDPIDVFLLTIGSTLRKFSPYYLNQAKSKIFQVVQDYELKQIVNKGDQPGNSNDVR